MSDERLKELLRARKRLLLEMFEKSPAFIAVFMGPDLVFDWVNARYYELVGHRELIGKKVEIALPEIKDQEFAAILREVLETGESFVGTEILTNFRRTPGGPLEPRYVDVRYQRIDDDHGSPQGVFVQGIDVTDKVNSRIQIETEKTDLEARKQELQLALESASMGTWHFDVKTNRVTVSHSSAEIFGLKEDENMFEANERLIYPKDLARTTRLWNAAIENRTVYTNEYRIVRPDGEVRWVYSSGRATYDQDGKPVSVSGVNIDITDRKRTEERILENEKRIRAFAESMPQMAFIADGDGNMIYFNQQYYSYFGLPAGDVKGWQWKNQSIHHPDDEQRTIDTWTESVLTGKPYQIEYRLRRYDGEYRWHLGRASAVHNDEGDIQQWYGTNTDIHDQKMHEAHLRKAKEQAEDASQSKSAFLANMSHEIRTPLGAILGFTELLKDSTSPIEKAEYSNVIARNGKALTKIIDDILDLSKVEAGRLELERIDFRVDELITEIMDVFQESAKSKNVNLYVEFSPSNPKLINSDPTRLRQILINLVGNAVKFTTNGAVYLNVSPIEEGGQVAKIRFEIKDSGIGMTQEQAARLFEPFSQADNSTTRRFGGSGLGLVLSRRLARALGGDVILEKCAPQQGCTFVATVEAKIPLKALAPTLDDLARENKMAASRTLARVLLVEDSPDNQMLVGLVLQRAGVKVDVANNGEEGFEKAMASNYDVILMDMQMPVLDGYAATMKLRASGYKKPIVALTAHAMGEERKRIMECGCDAHLTKPLDGSLLLKTIQHFGPGRNKSQLDDHS